MRDQVMYAHIQGNTMRSNLPALALSTLLFLGTVPAIACEAVSGAQTMAMVELYTSEGCSSCPPADRWLSAFSKANPDKVIALAFHVDYWDYLGWRDRFDSPRYSQRQRDLVNAAGGRTVYTPQVMVDGADRASWHESRDISAFIAATNRRAPGAQLTLKVNATAGNGWKAELAGTIKQPNRSQQIWLAVYEDGLSSDIHAGENSGSKLTHNRVVRGWYGPFRANANGQINLSQDVAAIDGLNPTQAGVVAFVQETSGGVLQAVSLPFCPHS